MFGNKYKQENERLKQELKDLRWLICQGEHDWVKISTHTESHTFGLDCDVYKTMKCKRCMLETTDRI